MKSRDLSYLIEAHLDGRLSADESAELSRALIAIPAARRQFWEIMAVHGLLQEAVQQEWLGAAIPQPQDKVVRFPRRHWSVALAAAASLVALIAVVRFLAGGGGKIGNGVAVLIHSVGVRWVANAEAKSQNAVLPPGRLQLMSGALEIEFNDGARVVVEGPAEFRIVSASKGYLQSGKITVHVPQRARGFTVNSSNLTVVDYGTDFGFVVSNAAPDEVHVFKGRVEVASGSLELRSLKAGEAVCLESNTLKSIEATPTAFLTEAELARRGEAGAEEHFTAWQNLSGALSADPATLLYYNFEDHSPDWHTLTNLANAAEPGTQGSIEGCIWTSGRLPGKHALNFRGKSNRVRLSVPQTMRQVTLIAWVRVDGLTREFHPLLCPDASQSGSLRWELTESGRLRFSIGTDLGRSAIDWSAVESESLMTPDRLGQWVMLVSTFDGSRVRHYCNGSQVGSGAAECPDPLMIGAADIGDSQAVNLRHFLGAMDEFAVLGRAVSAKEIRDLYEQGKP